MNCMTQIQITLGIFDEISIRTVNRISLTPMSCIYNARCFNPSLETKRSGFFVRLKRMMMKKATTRLRLCDYINYGLEISIPVLC